jgi:hypothetical protein
VIGILDRFSYSDAAGTFILAYEFSITFSLTLTYQGRPSRYTPRRHSVRICRLPGARGRRACDERVSHGGAIYPSLHRAITPDCYLLCLHMLMSPHSCPHTATPPVSLTSFITVMRRMNDSLYRSPSRPCGQVANTVVLTLHEVAFIQHNDMHLYKRFL